MAGIAALIDAAQIPAAANMASRVVIDRLLVRPAFVDIALTFLPSSGGMAAVGLRHRLAVAIQFCDQVV